MGRVGSSTEGSQLTGAHCPPQQVRKHLGASTRCAGDGVIVLVNINEDGKQAVSGMWEMLSAALSTHSQTSQANPSLSMPLLVGSPRNAGYRRVPHTPGNQQGGPTQGCVVQWSEGSALPCYQQRPVQPPRHSISPLAPLPSRVCSELTQAEQTHCGCPMSCPVWKMGEDFLMAAWVRCVLLPAHPWGHLGSCHPLVIRTPSCYPSPAGDGVKDPALGVGADYVAQGCRRQEWAA